MLCLALLMASVRSYSQSAVDSLSIDNKRLRTVVIGGGVLYAGTMIALDQIWYADYERSSFHFFNDNSEWLQMDKVGHIATAYHFSKAAKNSLLWAGVSQKKSNLYGAAYGLLFQTTLEILDGYSTNWGASMGDIAANTMGAGMLWSQDALWHEQRINFKFSYHTSPYASLRPNTFGSNWQERMLKDYNGQNYWLSANIHSFIPEKKIPRWLNLAVGYGIDGVVGASSNPPVFGHYQRSRQLLFSLDIELEKIPTKSKVLKFLFSTLSFIKIPAPTVMISNKENRFYWLYF